MPTYHTWVQYNVSYPTLKNTDVLFNVSNNHVNYIDFGVRNPTGTQPIYPLVNMGLKFTGNVDNIQIWLDSDYADLFPRGIQTMPRIREKVFDQVDNQNYFQVKFLPLTHNSESQYTTFSGITTSGNCGGFIYSNTISSSLNLGSAYLSFSKENNGFSYSVPFAIRIFSPLSSSSPLYAPWDIKNFKLRVSYNSVK